MFGTKKVATIVLAIRACFPLLLSIFLPRLVAHRSNCGVPCRGIAFTQKTIFLVCWSKDPSRATAALLAVAFFITKNENALPKQSYLGLRTVSYLHVDPKLQSFRQLGWRGRATQSSEGSKGSKGSEGPRSSKVNRSWLQQYWLEHHADSLSSQSSSAHLDLA